ncbi:isoleucine--tRNA ligase [Candidatus Microgenomates bacterium]|nr:isoleucine--tRNA ligase [Candidatus Microgenomates bacterium]
MKKVDPRQSFPKLEEEILSFWEKEKIFEKTLAKESPKGDFIFFEGPPTANGRPGIHHIFSRALKDVFLRYKTMQGFRVERKAGWDTHGLPVELEVEKKLNISGKPQIETLKKNPEESIADFNEQCKNSVWEYKTDWEQSTRRMGFWLDLERPYITYDNNYIESVWWILSEAFRKELIYKGHKVVPYCPRCGTALSSHEVAQGYKKVTENSVYVKFKVKKGQLLNPKMTDSPVTDDKTFILSWTTTPWTLPGNVALAVGSNIEYGTVKIGDETFIVAASRAEAVLKTTNFSFKMLGKDLDLEYEKLFNSISPEVGGYENAFRIYSADFVTAEDGTGVVHAAVMYGEEDYFLGELVDLPKVHTVDENGRFTFPSGYASSYQILEELENRLAKDKETEKIIVDYLKKQGDAGTSGLFGEPLLYEHDYPFCWRCDTALLYYAKDSWFIAMSKLKEKLKKNNARVNWIPAHMKDGRFGEWLEGVRDWAISRDRYWGTPLPFWQCQTKNSKSETLNSKSCGRTICIGSIEELKEKAVNFSEVFADEKSIDLHKPFIDRLKLQCECGGEMTRTPEVADCWLDSGSMPFAQWHYPFENKEKIDEKKFFPADFIAEGQDQTRGWFYTLLAVSTILELGPAYKNVISNGLVLDAKGQKMSKSRGNSLDPVQLSDSHGYDAIRWFFYTANQPGESKLMNEDSVRDQVRRFLLILWNTYSFFVGYASTREFTPRSRLGSTGGETSGPLFDRWLLSKKNRLIKKVSESLDKYDVFTSSRAIEEFTIELSTWYVRNNKKRTDDNFLAVLYETLLDITKLLAPFAPFVSEEIYRNLMGEESVHLASFPSFDEKLIDEKLGKEMEMVKKIVELGHALRKEKGIKVRQPLGELQIVNCKLQIELLNIISDELNVKSVSLETKHTLSPDDNWAEKEDGGVSIALNTEITPELKKEGLMREITRLIQDARKEARYDFDEKVEAYIETESEEIRGVFDSFIDKIKEQTKLSEINLTKVKDFDIKKEEIIDSQNIIVALKR